MRELYTTAVREGIPAAPLCPYVVRWAARHPGEAPPADPELPRTAKDRCAYPGFGPATPAG